MVDNEKIGGGRMKKEVNLARLEEVLATGGTRQTVCKEFGISPGLIDQRLKKDPAFRAAYERGRARRKQSKGSASVQPSKSTAIDIEPEDQDVLDAVEAAGKNGATMASIKRVDTVRGMEESEINASLRKLAALGRIHVKAEGVNQTETFYLAQGEEPGVLDTSSGAATNNGANIMATKKRASKRGGATKKQSGGRKTAAKKTGGKRGRSQNILSGAEKVEFIGRAEESSDSCTPSQALNAAYAEMVYFEQWGKPSPQYGVVMGMLASFRPQPSA